MLQHLLSFILALGGLAGFWAVGRLLRRQIIVKLLQINKITDIAVPIDTTLSVNTANANSVELDAVAPNVARELTVATTSASIDLLLPLIDYALGAWLHWTTIFLLGLAHLYYPITAYLLLTIGVILAIAQIYQLRTSFPLLINLLRPQDKVEAGLMLIITSLLGLGVIGAFTPPIAQDALVYHLVVPKAYIAANAPVQLPYNMFSYFPAAMEMLFLYGLLLGNSSIATLFHSGFALMTLLALVVLAQECSLPRRATLLACLAVLSVPTFWMEMGWAYVDLTVTFLVTLTLVLVLRYRRDYRTTSARYWLVMLGFSLGAVLSVKLTALAVIAFTTLLCLIILAEKKEKAWPIVLETLALPLMVALLTSSLWFLRNYYFTGNPCYPLLLNLFPNDLPGWDTTRANQYLLYIHLSFGGVDKTWLDYLLTFFKLAFLARYESAQYYQGVLGMFFLLLLVVPWFWRQLSRQVHYLLIFVLFFYLFWLLISQQVRFILPMLPAAAIAIFSLELVLETLLARYNLAPHRGPYLLRHALAIICLLVSLINIASIGFFFEEFKYWSLFTQSYNHTLFLQRKFDYFRTYEYLNNQPIGSVRVLLIDMSNQTYYLNQPAISDSVFEDYTIHRIVKQSTSTIDIKETLRYMQITHLMFRPQILYGRATTPFTLEEAQLFTQFLREHCQLLMREDEVVLLKLK
jgi:heme/copper-type cytochrome/quinol oxidase subunit 4